MQPMVIRFSAVAVRCMETVLSCKSESDGFFCPASGFIASALSPWFSSSEVLAHALKAFMELMDHGIVSWENLSAVFIKKVHGSFFHVIYICIMYSALVCDDVCDSVLVKAEVK